MPEILIGDPQKSFIRGIALEAPSLTSLDWARLFGHYNPSQDAFINDLFVPRSERYSGVGPQLIRNFERRAKELGARKVAAILVPETGFQTQLERWFGNKGYDIMNGNIGNRRIAIKHLI